MRAAGRVTASPGARRSAVSAARQSSTQPNAACYCAGSATCTTIHKPPFIARRSFCSAQSGNRIDASAPASASGSFVQSATEPPYRRRGGVVVAVLGSANCSACGGSMRPEPKLSSRSPGPSRLALMVRMRRMSAGVSLGLRYSNNATMPLTSAAATDVPVVI